MLAKAMFKEKNSNTDLEETLRANLCTNQTLADVAISKRALGCFCMFLKSSMVAIQPALWFSKGAKRC